MHSGGFELTKLTYTRLEDNLIRHRGDRIPNPSPTQNPWRGSGSAGAATRLGSVRVYSVAVKKYCY